MVTFLRNTLRLDARIARFGSARALLLQSLYPSTGRFIQGVSAERPSILPAPQASSGFPFSQPYPVQPDPGPL